MAPLNFASSYPSIHYEDLPDYNDSPLVNTSTNKTRANIDEVACKPSEEQARMLQLINEARAEARSCGDEDFKVAGPLTWNCKLEEASWNHTGDMVDNSFFSHSGSDGLYAGDRIDKVGYNWRVYGENLAAGYVYEEDALQGLLDSPGHCRNIMNAKFKEFGSARIFPENRDYISYWTHVYGTAF